MYGAVKTNKEKIVGNNNVLLQNCWYTVYTLFLKLFVELLNKSYLKGNLKTNYTS